MRSMPFPTLDTDALAATRDALHAYSKIAGSWLRATQSQRKHWWHISLRPSLNGLTTGVIYNEVNDFEIELNLADSLLTIDTSDDASLEVLLEGQSTAAIGHEVREFLGDVGISADLMPAEITDHKTHGEYSPEQAATMQTALAGSSAVLTELRAGIAEETSPLGLWPHHFDLAMLWLPGYKIAGQDPNDEEHSDVHMNFGFSFGDSMVPEPYYYVTAYPTPEDFPQQALQDGTEWFSDGFTGLVWRYKKLIEADDPANRLLTQMQALLDEGRQKMKV